MTSYHIHTIAKLINATIIGDGSKSEIRHLLFDSRSVISPNGSCFFALRGERHDGHLYINDLYEKGVCIFVVDTLPENEKLYPLAVFLKVKDTLKAMQEIAAFHRKNFEYPIIGITGSNGKTIIKEWLFQSLSPYKSVIRSPKSYNSQIGVPLSIWQLYSEADLAIIEAGISVKKEMPILEEIIKPTIGLITNVGGAHQENFKSFEEKIKEKLLLFKDVETIIYCKDHELIAKEINKSKLSEKTITWSRKDKKADIYISSIKQKGKSSEIILNLKNEDTKISLPFTDDASIENSLHVIAVLDFLGINNKTIKKQIKSLKAVAMRLEQKEGINNCTIINDSYNSDTVSLKIAIDFLNQQKQNKRKTLILSDILQTGQNPKDLYKEIANNIEKSDIDRFIGIGTEMFKSKQLFKKDAKLYLSTDDFIASFKAEDFKKETILIKGAREFEFERISEILELKTHTTVLEINLRSLVHNLNHFRSLLRPETKIMIMVKAFSYGNGSYEIANILQHQRVDYLCVAYADEGLVLRRNGITVPIMVLNPEEKSYDMMIAHDLEPEIYNMSVLKNFYRSIVRNNVSSFPIHIKLDTGMHRLGFEESDMTLLLKELKKCSGLEIKSVFSHLAATDEKEFDDFTRLQVSRYEKMIKLLEEEGHKPIKHVLNSAGIERFPEYQFDMARLGIGLYGASVKDSRKLKNVSTLKTKVSQIKNVPKSETIGYSRKGKITKNTKVATISVGYADGISRNLSNGVGKFLLNGKFVPTIGNICMDMCMLKVDGLKVYEGDEVVIFGEDNPFTEIAKALNTIPHEILTGISERVKRVYFQE